MRLGRFAKRKSSRQFMAEGSRAQAKEECAMRQPDFGGLIDEIAAKKIEDANATQAGQMDEGFRVETRK
jgi:hypothetical protein